MNIRKVVDHTDMYTRIDVALQANLSPMERYFTIGQAVAERPEKGAAVAAAEYIQKNWPDAKGYSPRNLRRMRELYRVYGDCPEAITLAEQIGWTQNVMILEAGLDLSLRLWYMRAVRQFGWSKLELIAMIESSALTEIVLDNGLEVYDNENIEFETEITGPLQAVKYSRKAVPADPTAMSGKTEDRSGKMAHYVMSFIHGEADRFHAMLKKIRFSVDDTLYILGDVIDWGPDGISLLREIMAAPNMVMLLGNHEHMMMDYLKPDPDPIAIRRWNKNGNRPTLDPYLKFKASEQQEILDYLKSLPTYLEVEINGKRFYLVHGFPGANAYDEVWCRSEIDTPNLISGCQLIIRHPRC